MTYLSINTFLLTIVTLGAVACVPKKIEQTKMVQSGDAVISIDHYVQLSKSSSAADIYTAALGMLKMSSQLKSVKPQTSKAYRASGIDLLRKAKEMGHPKAGNALEYCLKWNSK